MAFKPNYNFERAERNRVKQAKKEAKAREQQEARARRKAGIDEPGMPDTDPDAAPSVSSDPGA